MTDLGNLANMSVVYYVSFCTLFFTIKYYNFKDTQKYWVIIFIVTACILQFINNFYLSKYYCGDSQIYESIYAALVPWILVFGLFSYALYMFPGWNRVFSNTIGTWIIDKFGNDAIDNIFKDSNLINIIQNKKVGVSADNLNSITNTINAIQSIYRDKTKFINELNINDATVTIKYKEGTQEQDMDKKIQIRKDKKGNDEEYTIEKKAFKVDWPILDKLLSTGIITEAVSDVDKKDLYDNILLKDTIGYYAWYILIGSLTVLISTNTLLNNGCGNKDSEYKKIFT